MASSNRKTDPDTSKNANTRLFIAGREGARQIKLHDQNQVKAKSGDEAVVKTGSGLPDMRFAENQNAFKRDPSKKLNGDPDRRFLENRPDLIGAHVKRGQDKPNLIFTDDMLPELPAGIDLDAASK